MTRTAGVTIGATFLVAGAASLWGLWSLVLRPTELPATTTGPLMFAFTTLWSLPFALRGPRPTFTRRVMLLCLGNALFDAVNVLTFFAAMGETTVAIAVVTHYAAPMIVALAAPYIDGIRIRGAVFAASVALLGLALVLEPWRTDSEWIVGGALGLASAFMYAGNVFTGRRLAAAVGAPWAMASHTAIAALLLAPLALGELGSVEAADLGVLAIATLFLGTLAGIAYLRGLLVIGATRASMLTFCEPIVAVLVGVLVFGEALRAVAAVGAVLVLSAGAWVIRQPAPAT